MGDQAEAVAAPSNAAPARSQVLADMPWEAPADKAAATDEAAPVEKTETATQADAVEETDDEKAAKPVETKADETPTDPESAKRMSAIAKAEKRSRDLLAKERADAKASFDAEVERIKLELGPKADAARKYEAAMAQARTNPVELLRSLGLTEDDFAYVGQQLYNHSKEAAADPKRAAAAAAARKEREEKEEMRQLKARIDAFEQEKRQQTEAQQIEANKTRYLDDIVPKIPADAPLLKKLLEKSPTKARAEMWKEAERLFAESGEFPDADDIAQAYETRRRTELDELGIDVASVLKPAAAVTTAPTTPAARPAKTLDTSAAATAPLPKPVAKETDAERRARLLKEMPWDAS